MLCSKLHNQKRLIQFSFHIRCAPPTQNVNLRIDALWSAQVEKRSVPQIPFSLFCAQKLTDLYHTTRMST